MTYSLPHLAAALKRKRPEPEGAGLYFVVLNDSSAYALKELPQPQVDFTFGLLNLKPEPSSVST